MTSYGQSVSGGAGTHEVFSAWVSVSVIHGGPESICEMLSYYVLFGTLPFQKDEINQGGIGSIIGGTVVIFFKRATCQYPLRKAIIWPFFTLQSQY